LGPPVIGGSDTTTLTPDMHFNPHASSQAVANRGTRAPNILFPTRQTLPV